MKTEIKLFPHPAYSSDVAPSDYHIFGLLEDALYGGWFVYHEEVKVAVKTWPHVWPKTFFTDGIRKFMDQS